MVADRRRPSRGGRIADRRTRDVSRGPADRSSNGVRAPRSGPHRSPSKTELRVPRRSRPDREGQGHLAPRPSWTPSANALVAAYKRRPGAAEEAFVTIDPESGEIRVYGQELDEDGNVVQEWDDTPEDFGRIAAQTAKQVILQRIREAERDLKYEEYAGREGDIVTGIVQQTDNRYTLLDLGKVEALLPQAEQVPYERYEHGARLKAYIVEVRKTTKGPADRREPEPPGTREEALRARGPRDLVGGRRDKGGRARARSPDEDRGLVERSQRRSGRRLRRRAGIARADGHQRAPRRAHRRRPVLRRPGGADPGGAAAGTGPRGEARRRDRARRPSS